MSPAESGASRGLRVAIVMCASAAALSILGFFAVVLAFGDQAPKWVLAFFLVPFLLVGLTAGLVAMQRRRIRHALETAAASQGWQWLHEPTV
ncbi:MAG: hypothetical protein ABR562_09185, partial [Thermoplasmatota archaeon]